MSDENVIPADQLTPEQMAEAQDAARAAFLEMSRGGVSLTDLSVAASSISRQARRLNDVNLTADVTEEVMVGVVSVTEVKAAQEVAERVGEGGMKKAIKKARQKAIKQMEANRRAEIEIARTPRTREERRKLKRDPLWSRDGSYAASLGIKKKPKGTKSPKKKKRK